MDQQITPDTMAKLHITTSNQKADNNMTNDQNTDYSANAKADLVVAIRQTNKADEKQATKTTETVIMAQTTKADLANIAVQAAPQLPPLQFALVFVR